MARVFDQRHGVQLRGVGRSRERLPLAREEGWAARARGALPRRVSAEADERIGLDVAQATADEERAEMLARGQLEVAARSRGEAAQQVRRAHRDVGQAPRHERLRHDLRHHEEPAASEPHRALVGLEYRVHELALGVGTQDFRHDDVDGVVTVRVPRRGAPFRSGQLRARLGRGLVDLHQRDVVHRLRVREPEAARRPLPGGGQQLGPGDRRDERGEHRVDDGLVLVLHKAVHAQHPGSGTLGLQVPMHVAHFAYTLCLKIWSVTTSYGFSIYGVDVPYNAVKGKSAKRSHDLLVMLKSGGGIQGHG